MRGLRGYLILVGGVGGLVLGMVMFRGLGLSHVLLTIMEVLFRASALAIIALVAWWVRLSEGESFPSFRMYKGVVYTIAFIGAALIMTFWHRWFP